MSATKRATVADASPSPEVEQPPLPPTSEEESTTVDAPLPADELVSGASAPPLPKEVDPTSTSQAPDDKEDDVWDPSAETDLKGRKAVEEKSAGDVKDTGGWQAVWAPTANGKPEFVVDSKNGELIVLCDIVRDSLLLLECEN